METSGDVEIEQLVSSAKGGESEAFGALYERLAPRVYGYLYHRVGYRAELAEDLTEDVFVKVIEKLDRYEDRGLPFVAWVYRVAHNHLVDHFRTRPRGMASLEACSELSEQGAERHLERRLQHAELGRALRQLTEDQRRVVLLRFLQGLSVLETAQALGKTEDAVKKLQARGLLALRRALGPAALVDLAA